MPEINMAAVRELKRSGLVFPNPDAEMRPLLRRYGLIKRRAYERPRMASIPNWIAAILHWPQSLHPDHFYLKG